MSPLPPTPPMVVRMCRTEGARCAVRQGGASCRSSPGREARARQARRRRRRGRHRRLLGHLPAAPTRTDKAGGFGLLTARPAQNALALASDAECVPLVCLASGRAGSCCVGGTWVSSASTRSGCSVRARPDDAVVSCFTTLVWITHRSTPRSPRAPERGMSCSSTSGTASLPAVERVRPTRPGCRGAPLGG